MKYKVTYIIEKEVEFDDNEIREYGFEGEITDEVREKYLNTLLIDEYEYDIDYYNKRIIELEEK